MSDSRLEKFIYAICSMDVSDLPVPLSRIETLWNCLITGETPDFEPLSRNEKYLMAMLDRYDISNLPAPMSRGEKLLYKIAVGETDLSDVPGYLSQYEELLKYLIENGGISEEDFEYVLYTLNQSMHTLYTTAEKPVKSATLKGQTLVNIDSYYDRNDFYKYGADYIDEDGFIQLTARGAWINAHTHNNSLVKPNTKYAIIVDIKENTLDSSMSNALKICTNTDTLESVWSAINGIEIAGGVTGRLFFTATTSDKVSGVKTLQRAYIGSALKTGHIKYRWMIIEYQKGMENWDIPYFRGMTSVKMPVLTTTRKNLFDINSNSRILSGSVTNFQPLTFEGNQVSVTSKFTCSLQYLVKLKPNTEYAVTVSERNEHNKGSQFRIGHYSPTEDSFTGDWNNILADIHLNNNKSQATFVTDVTGYIVAILNPKSWDEFLTSTFYDIQLEEGSTATTYEPYKSNILTVNEDVTLRGIGDVKDELDCLNGEVVTRIKELNLKEITHWEMYTNLEINETVAFYCDSTSFMKNYVTNPNSFLCNSLPVPVGDIVTSRGYECIGIGGAFLKIRIAKSKLSEISTKGLINYLNQNDIIIVGYSASESIKTVDLTIVDQDNQPTQLGTFENLTRVSLESSGLIPEVEMEVATIISEELASASPLMDDISTEQRQLNTTVDEQSDNVDATMIATTEIYEETL